MLIVLPPSEGKTAPGRGAPFRPTRLSFPELGKARTEVSAALLTLCSGDPLRAAQVLGLGPRQQACLQLNTALSEASAGRAIQIYTGVLYDALDEATLSAAERSRLNRTVAIASGLFGLLRPSDHIPAYRLSGGVTLPNIGALAAFWRGSVSAAIEAVPGVILDLRSGAYVALGPIPPAAAHRGLIGRVLLEQNGKRSVSSHQNKATKGRLVRALMQSGAAPKNIKALIATIIDLGYRCELNEVTMPDRAATLDIIVRET